MAKQRSVVAGVDMGRLISAFACKRLRGRLCIAKSAVPQMYWSPMSPAESLLCCINSSCITM